MTKYASRLSVLTSVCFLLSLGGTASLPFQSPLKIKEREGGEGGENGLKIFFYAK